MSRRRTAALAALSLSLFLWPRPIAAQDSTTTRRTPADSTRPKGPRVVPSSPIDVPIGPLPPGSRYTFTRDSVRWSNAFALADLLNAIPGAYIARTGFSGQPEYLAYAGRGAQALELYRDGIPVIPLGGDSTFIDPSRIPLNALQRVDVEVLPGQLRVFMMSERYQTVDTRSEVGFTNGDFGTGQYTGLFQKRWANGLGLNLGADFFGSNGAVGSTRSDQAFEAWGRAEWIPTPTSGVVYELRRQNDDHDPVAGLQGVPGTPARKGSRTDASLRLFSAARADRRGFSGSVDLASQSWTDDSLVADRTIRLAIARGRFASSQGALELTGRLTDGPTPRSLEARGGLVPAPGILVSGDGRVSGYAGDRTGTRGHAAVALYRGPFSLTGEASYAREPQAPALVTDSVRRTVDRAARLGFATPVFTANVGLVRRGAYAPMPFPDIRLVFRASPTPPSTYIVSDVHFQPIRPLTLEAWYAHPRVGGADFQPPHNSRWSATFRSKFWRTFRSGAFDLKVQVAGESWSAGLAGLSSVGGPIILPGLTFTEVYIGFQIVGFTAFWDLRNAWNTIAGYVPGYQPYPRNAQTFGVKWEFMN